MIKHPTIYEINTRVWIRQFSTETKAATLADIPSMYWDDLKSKGIDLVWLMGIWKICKSAVMKYAFEPDLVIEYKKALKDWTEEDVIGSPYAIDTYDVSYELGSIADIQNIKAELNRRDMKLILDYVPNHFSADSLLLRTHPDIFLYTNENYFNDDPHTFYKPHNESKYAFAHGRDPFFPAWQDTVQVNYFNVTARDFMSETLIRLSKICDGLRCDMAMLALNNVFKNTWGGVLKEMGFDEPEEEFWDTAINLVRKERKDFIFIGEVYWDLEWKLQQLGFNYTYDKELTERIRTGHVSNIKSHLNAESDYQMKSLRFLENHDETRSLKLFGKEKALAAAVLISTIQGMKFFYEGQFEGRMTKLPVQLGRFPKESDNKSVQEFYNNLLAATSDEIFKNGDWKQLKAETAWDNDKHYKNILCWEWIHKDQKRLVVINFSNQVSAARIRFDVSGYTEEIKIRDTLNNENYKRKRDEIDEKGLYIKLNPFRSHIFSF